MTDKTVEKFRLPYREYYRLHQAAEILGCSVDDLIHWAANTELTLYANLLGLLCTVHKTRCFRDEPDQPLFDDALPDGMYMVTPDDMRYFELDGFCECVEFHWADKRGHYWHAEVDVPIKIQQKHLFVPAWVIENMKRDVPKKPFAPDGEKRREHGAQPHHVAERFARYREQVLKAAIYCKETWPEQCKTYRAWAELVDQKAQLFWPETGEPPLKPEQIERLLGSACKIAANGE